MMTEMRNRSFIITALLSVVLVWGCSEDFIERVANKTDKNKKERKAQIGFYDIRDPNTRYIGG